MTAPRAEQGDTDDGAPGDDGVPVHERAEARAAVGARAPVEDDPWSMLRTHTPARIALGRAGCGLPTREVLAFGAAHALAREAVHATLDMSALVSDTTFEEDGLLPTVLASRAEDRRTFLLRPDWGRRLAETSRALLAHVPHEVDVAWVICDGLSANAVRSHSREVMTSFLSQARPHGWSLSGPFLVKNGRVAVGDEIGEAVRARLVIVLIGERPGLRAPDSLGAYVTYQPHVGCRDSQRVCISNIRDSGTAPTKAGRLLTDVATAAFDRGGTGVGF